MGKPSILRAIAKTIDACSKAGGGTVLIPAGLWLTGPIELKKQYQFTYRVGSAGYVMSRSFTVLYYGGPGQNPNYMAKN